MLSRILAVPFLLGTAIAVLLAMLVASDYAIWIIPQVIFLAVLYVLSPQIDWWYYKRKPPEMPLGMQRALHQFSGYYAALSEENKRHFRHRVMMYLRAVAFIGKPWDEIPEDLQMMVAVNVVRLTFGLEDYRLTKFERIVIYPHPFPSPQFPDHLHNSELYEEDGVLLFCAAMLIAGFRQPNKNYNVALHEYAKAFRLSYPDHGFADEGEELWERLEKVGAFTRQHIKDTVGLPEVDPVAVSINYFFSFPERFKTVFPDIFERYKHIFNQDPTHSEDPVIDSLDYTKF